MKQSTPVSDERFMDGKPGTADISKQVDKLLMLCQFCFYGFRVPGGWKKYSPSPLLRSGAKLSVFILNFHN